MKTSRHHLIVLALAGSTLLAAGAAQAQSAAKSSASGFYGEVGFTPLEFKDPGIKLYPKQVRLIGGYDVHPNLAVEGLIGLGAKEDKVEANGVTLKFNVDYTVGLFLKPKVAVTPELELFGRVGYARTKYGFSSSVGDMDVSVSTSKNDTAYGVGAAYALNEKISINLDYMSYFSKDDAKIKGITLGVGMKF